MDKLKIKYLWIEMRFPDSYPFKPPFVRLITPFFKYHTGHITQGGSFCTEALTDEKWIPTTDIYSLLLQIVILINDGGGIIDEEKYSHQYSLDSAKTSFAYAKAAHGWK